MPIVILECPNCGADDKINKDAGEILEIECPECCEAIMKEVGEDW